VGFVYQDERFADLQLLRYRLNGFDELSLRQKKLIYYLSKATLFGRDITFDQYGKYLDILGVSCDSIHPEVNLKHGRNYNQLRLPVEQSRKTQLLSEICHHQGILFKVNTVVTQLNKNEILADFINQLDPCRWKVFQILEIENENGGGKVKDLMVSPKEFEKYIQNNLERLHPHKKKILVKESNDLMQNSYVIVDEFGRILDVSSGCKLPTHSVLKVGIKKALMELGNGFDQSMFYKRGGYYQWQKPLKVATTANAF